MDHLKGAMNEQPAASGGYIVVLGRHSVPDTIQMFWIPAEFTPPIRGRYDEFAASGGNITRRD
jgi:hypothetical protein